MRIAIGMLWQETNAFNPLPTTLENFETMGIFYGDQVIEKFADVGELGGFIQAARSEKDVELIPTMRAMAWPSGKCDERTHQFLKNKLLDELRKAGRLDGILLAFHGAMTAEDEYDVEGDLLKSIRDEWNEEIPIVISLDHHANITKRMIESVNALVGYHTEPHVDMFETGFKAAKIMFATVKKEIKPIIGWRKIPMIATGDLRVPGGPLEEFFRKAEALEKMDEVISVSIFPENPYIDSPELGWSVVVITDNEARLAQKLADQLAKEIWKKRRLFLAKKQLSPSQAVKRALEIEGGPVILSDRADATNSGAPGDSTAILKELLGKKLKGKAMLTIVDPEAVDRAIRAGVGKEVTLEVGGKIDKIHSQPVKVTGRVRKITDGRFVVQGPMTKGLEANMKRTVVLEVNDIYIVLSEAPGPGHDPSLYRSVGLEPREAKIVVVKSPMGFRAAYEPFAKEILIVDGPGAASPDIQSLFPLYKRIPRPIFPLDKDTTFEI